MLAGRCGALRRLRCVHRAAFFSVSVEPPPPSYRRTASAYSKINDAAASDRERFWLDAAQEVHWFKSPTIALDESNAPFYRWFPDGTTNMVSVESTQRVTLSAAPLHPQPPPCLLAVPLPIALPPCRPAALPPCRPAALPPYRSATMPSIGTCRRARQMTWQSRTTQQ